MDLEKQLTLEKEPSHTRSASSDGRDDGFATPTASFSSDAPLAPDQLALPRADGGAQAWLCLAGCFVASMLIWGFAISFGILQEYYTTHEPFEHSGGIPAVGTTATGVSYLTMPLYFYAFRRWPWTRQWSLRVSLPLVAASLIGASFAETVTHLLLSQGILYALGGNALVVPTITYLDEWFFRRKGLAVGIMWAGDGTGGVIMPLLMRLLLEKIGFRWTLRAIAGIMVLLNAPMLFFLKPRLPVPAGFAARPLDLKFLRMRVFWVLQIFNIIQALGYCLPTNYMPSQADSLGLGASIRFLPVLLVNLASVGGCLGVGTLADRFEITSIIFGVSVGAAGAVLLLWGFSSSYTLMCIFSVVYGLTAGGYATTWGGVVLEVQRSFKDADGGLIFGLLAAGKGVGSIVSGPVSEALVRTGGSSTGMLYDTQYRSIVIFTGCTALLGGSSWLFRKSGFI